MTIFEVSVPATTANIGAGFDCLGAALSLYNHFEFSLADRLTIIASGEGADKALCKSVSINSVRVLESNTLTEFIVVRLIGNCCKLSSR